MVQNKLAEDAVKTHGWLLDGYPRSGEQAEAIEKEGIRPDVFLLINVRPLCSPGACLLAACVCLCLPGADAVVAAAQHCPPFPLLLPQVPDELLIDRVVGRRSDPGEPPAPTCCARVLAMLRKPLCHHAARALGATPCAARATSHLRMPAPNPAETGEIYHLTFKPPPPEIVPRLVRSWRRPGRRRAAGGALLLLPACTPLLPLAGRGTPHGSPRCSSLPVPPAPVTCRCSAATTQRRRR